MNKILIATLLLAVLLTVAADANFLPINFQQFQPPSNLLYQQQTVFPQDQHIRGSFSLFNGRMNPSVEVTSGFNLKPPQFPTGLPFLGNNNFQRRTFPAAIFNPFEQRPLFRIPLFTPNTKPQRAETKGQVEMFNKALQEEARETETELNDITTDDGFDVKTETEPGTSTEPRSFVNVNIRAGNDKDYNYGYST